MFAAFGNLVRYFLCHEDSSFKWWWCHWRITRRIDKHFLLTTYTIFKLLDSSKFRFSPQHLYRLRIFLRACVTEMVWNCFFHSSNTPMNDSYVLFHLHHKRSSLPLKKSVSPILMHSILYYFLWYTSTWPYWYYIMCLMLFANIYHTFWQLFQIWNSKEISSKYIHEFHCTLSFAINGGYRQQRMWYLSSITLHTRISWNFDLKIKIKETTRVFE